MKKKSKLLYIIILVLIGLLVLSSCKANPAPPNEEEEEESLENKVSYKTIAYKIDLQDSCDKMTDNKAIADYLMSWADSKNVSATRDANGNVIMSIKASASYQDAPLTVVVCPYDASNYKNCVNTMALSLYLARNAEGYGPVQIIFTPSQSGDFSGAMTLPPTLFPDDCKVFCLSTGLSDSWALNTGGLNNYKFTGAANTTAPRGNMAIHLKIEGLTEGLQIGSTSSYSNPIKEFADLLANFKSKAMIFELASMSGGSKSSVLPAQAEMTIVINRDDVEKFLKKISSSIDHFTEKNNENNPDLTYTYEEVPMPDAVYDKDTMNTFVGALYSLIDGVYSAENDKVISLANLAHISCAPDSYMIEASGCSAELASLVELDTDYKTICSLSGIDFEKVSFVTPFKADLDDKAYKTFADNCAAAYKDFTNDKLEFDNLMMPTVVNVLQTIKPDCHYVNVMMNEASLEKDTGAIMTFIINQNHKAPSEDKNS